MAARLMLVHAHPDDETINCGATMAAASAAGIEVSLVTCTLGDEGEILVPEVAHLGADGEDQLGAYRFNELQAALAHLSSPDNPIRLHVLGGRDERGSGHWRDSGMAGTASNDKPRAFIHADSTAAEQLAELIVQTRPHVVITYDASGGYGHPDHIQAHRIAHAAVTFAATRGWRVSKVYACARVLEIEIDDRRRLAALGSGAQFKVGTDDFHWATPRDVITTEIDATPFTEAKRKALGAHATQVLVEGDWYALSDHIGAALRGREFYVCEVGIPIPNPDHEHHWETDVFAGVDVTT